MNARRRTTALAAAAAAALCLVACAGGPTIGIRLPKQTRFEAEWQIYKKLPEHKSLAVAGDRDGIYAAGVAYDHRHRESAIEAALRYCEERRVDRRIEAPCQTVAINHEPSVHGLDADAPPRPR